MSIAKDPPKGGKGRAQKQTPADAAIMLLQQAIKWGLQEAPAATRVAIAGLVVLAAALALASIWVPISSILVLAVAILLFGLLATLVGKYVEEQNAAQLGLLVAWAIALLSLVSAAAFVLGALIGVPEGLAVRVAQILRSPLLIGGSGTTVSETVDRTLSISNFPAVTQSVGSGNVYELRQKLMKKPDLILKAGGTMELPALTGDARAGAYTLSVRRLIFDGGAIVTNGNNLTIEAAELQSSGNGRILSFVDPGNSESMRAGRNAGKLELFLYGEDSGRLTIDLRGQNGQF